MKTLFKAIAVASLATATAAQAELSASVAVDSSYIFRGIEQDGSTTASVTVGYEVAGFSIGAWIADANDSTLNPEGAFVETDLSVAYTAAVAGHDVTFSYTDYAYDYDGEPDADNEGFQEFAVGTTVSGLGVNYVSGSADAAADYTVLSLDYTLGNTNVLLANVNSDDDNSDYSFFEVSVSAGQVAGLDVSLTYTGTFSEDTGSDANGLSNNALVIGLSKGFDL